MGRKKRTVLQKNEVIAKPINEPLNTGIYARLSAENSHKNDDGNAIENQVEACRNFINENPQLILADTYIDNGKTGTNFDRPEFNRLINDIEKGKIKCLVVRDLSRFGRDYIETGTYLERVFPDLGLRFISVNEKYDSSLMDSSNESLMIPLQNMINGIYAKDISRKVSTAHQTRFLSGEFKRNTLPYGYMLDETRRKVIVDEATAEFVRLIFTLRANGKSIKEIISTLNELNAPNPKVRKAEINVQKGNVSNSNGFHYSTIQNILKNHTYLGHTVIGKKVRAFYRGIICEDVKDESKWIFLENTHQPIISEELFYTVQEIRRLASENKAKKMKETAKKRAQLNNLFTGKIYCADCLSPLTFNRLVDRNNFNAYYKCSKYIKKKNVQSTK